MAFPDVLTNLASAQAAEDERKRRAQQIALQQDEADLKQARDARLAEDARGPAAALKEILSGRRSAAVSGDLQRDAEQDQFQNTQAQERFARRAADLERRARPLAVPGPSGPERALAMAAPLGDFATEEDSQRASELKYDPRGRGARLQAQMAGLERPDASREAPIYTDAPKARDTGETMPYTGALDALLGLDVPRAAIRKEFGGTAEDRTLRFSDRPEVGMRHYNNPRTGETRDVGARGGGLIQAKGSADDTSTQGVLLSYLKGEADVAKRQPFTPQEVAQDLTVQQPGWDTMAARSDPTTVLEQINAAIGAGQLNPKTGQALQHRYAGYADAATDPQGEFRPEVWQNFLATARTPAPGEATARAQAGGQAVPAAKGAERQAISEALQPVQNAPGSTPSPALTAANPTPQRTPQVGTQATEQPSPETGGPGWLRTGVGEAARYGLPIAGQALGGLAGGIFGRSPGAMLAGKAAGGAIGGAGGTAIADYLENVPINPKDELVAALLGGAVGPGLGLAGRAGRAVGRVGKGMAESAQGYRAAPGVARGFQAVEEARQLGRGALGAGQQLAGNIAAEGVPGLAQTALGERGRQLTPDLIRLLATRKGPKPTAAELNALLQFIGRQ